MTCHFLLFSPHSPNPHSSTKFPAHIHPFEDSPHLRQHFTALLHWLLSPTGKRIVIIHDTLMASIVQDSVSIPNTESYAFNTVSAFFSFFDLREALGKPFQIEVEVFRAGDLINTNRSMDDTYIDLLENIPGNKKYWAVGSINPVTIYEQINENAISLEQSNTKFIWVLRYADKVDIFTEECRRSAKLPEGFENERYGDDCKRLDTPTGNIKSPINWKVHESLWMEFMLGEPEHGSTDCSLAYALRPTKECCADIRCA
ncbi:hypothetical protein EZV62_005312 [Acer yangbiense]|uniref:Glycosyltransferase N-terminal domain-containing protein n=1 Tax=Acer yangbiense TaxID=1000413 RepID=A0A5C7ILU6_9ROSI|nr:hypothetical protein EZV62_005312 [Acer yangbiense]